MSLNPLKGSTDEKIYYNLAERFTADLSKISGRNLKVKAKWVNAWGFETHYNYHIIINEPTGFLKSKKIVLIIVKIFHSDGPSVEVYIQAPELYKFIKKLTHHYQKEFDDVFKRKVKVTIDTKYYLEIRNQEFRLFKKFFQRFANELEQKTKRKYFVKDRYPLSDFKLDLKEHLGFMKNKRVLSVKADSLSENTIYLTVAKFDATLPPEVYSLIQEYQQKLEKKFNRQVVVNFNFKREY